ncbi:MAG: MMPL family transporter [Clostridia bacterium]|nr:MMPL family transporter [Clostridia bacterium]
MNSKQSRKYIVLALFFVVTVISFLLMNGVKTNYNISDYLDESTETKISLNIIEDNFETTGNIQVMVENVSVEEAYKISSAIKSVENVLFVNFDENDTAYYKDGDALFAVIVKGDEYSSTANEVLDNIQSKLDDLLENEINYGGSVVEKRNMRDTLKVEIVLILGIAIVFAYAIMLLMAKSWLEPLFLLVPSGIAVLINLGTNVIFGEISYITKAVAAILQLALSVDYSIILLHEYRNQKNNTTDKDDAMMLAIKKSFAPIFSSALTTMAGLVALFFMTMKIGFDIGVVLTKGIAISAITSLTLLPAVLICVDKVMNKTSKRDLVISGERFCKIAFKSGKPIVALALVVVILCGVLQMGNSYLFTDSANPNQEIIDTFGANNTVVVVYPKEENMDNVWEKEALLVEKLSGYKTADGKSVLHSYNAYSNTVRELYTLEKAMEKLNLSEDDAKFLFSLYHEHDSHKMDMRSFVEYTSQFLKNDPDGQQFADEKIVNTIDTLLVIDKIMNGYHTPSELHTLATTGVLEGTDLSLFQIEQMHGLYLYDKLDDNEVDFVTMLKYINSVATSEKMSGLMDEQTIADLAEFETGLVDFIKNMETTVDKAAFEAFAIEKFASVVGEQPAKWIAGLIFDNYNRKYNDGKNVSVTILNLLDYTVNEDALGVLATGLIRDLKVVKDMVNNYSFVYYTIKEPCAYDEFLPLLDKAVIALTGETRVINSTTQAVQQGYIMYYYEKGLVPNERIQGREFIGFVNNAIQTNPVVNGRISEDSKLKLLDLETVDKYLSNDERYLYEDMSKNLKDLQEKIKSLDATNTITPSMILNIYAKYAINDGNHNTDPIIAGDLLTFVAAQMDINDQLKAKMTDEHRKMVRDRLDAVNSAEGLFLGYDHSTHGRMLLSVDLPSEGEESTKFVDYLLATVKEVFGEEGHIAGHMISTVDLQNTFAKDNTIITIVTIIAIFLIIMLVFKSLSLPILLVLVIQGAIWISMATSLITGPMFFMSYIIATCILMGATIDYGILMSSTYVDARATMDKKDALLLAVNTAIPTVFTSGLILTICGFIVGLVASQTSISTVGTLLGKGALVSSLMVTLVLPSVLYLLDGFILKLSVTKKNNAKKKAE